MPRIVIGGPPNCGKSTLVTSLYSEMARRGVPTGLHEIDVYSDTHDCILGKKPWSERKKRHHAWFEPTIRQRILEFASDGRDVVLGDLPGNLRNQFLLKMVAPGEVAVVVAKDQAGMDSWEEFFSRASIPVGLRVLSYQGDAPAVPRGVHAVSGLARTIVRSPELTGIANGLLALCERPRVAAYA